MKGRGDRERDIVSGTVAGVPERASVRAHRQWEISLQSLHRPYLRKRCIVTNRVAR